MILGGKDMANKLNLTTPENPIPLPNVGACTSGSAYFRDI